MKNEMPDSECVTLKNRIQEELTERYRGLTEQEREAQRLQDILAHPTLGPFFQELQADAAKRRDSGKAA